MIVKVQISLVTTKEKRQVLVYNKDRSITYEADATDDVIALVGDFPKAYFKAHLDEAGKIVLDGRVKDQNW